MPTTTRPPRLRRTGALAAGLGVLLLGGCADAVNLPPAPYAADPVCAEVLQMLPGEVNEGAERSIGNQAMAAWGDPAITLRCGVEPPGPSTERCITVESGETSVDWLALEGDDELVPEHAQREEGAWTFLSYGRVPAIEVVVPTERADSQPTGALVAMAPAVELTAVERECIGVTDVY